MRNALVWLAAAACSTSPALEVHGRARVGPTRAVAPWSLTASDGSGLALVRVDAKAVVEGPLAFTELHLYFHNPETRAREGTFAIALPAGAGVSRFALETNGELVEAEVVDKQLGRVAYEASLHRKVDPALLEKDAGNRFTARVFPIAPSADKHVVIGFTQTGTPGHYELLLRGLAEVGRLDARVDVRGRDGTLTGYTLAEHDWVPDRDFVVDTASAPVAVAAGELVAAQLKVDLPVAADVPAGVTLLVDTSASSAPGFPAEVRALRDVVGELARRYGGELPVAIVAFDQTTVPIASGRAGELEFEAALLSRGALGASDLGQALTWLADHHPLSRVMIATDGVVTAGAGLDALPALVAALAGVGRVDVVLAGRARDAHAAAAIATGAVLDLDRGADDVARRAGLAVRRELRVHVPGARWIYPATIAAAQPGDDVVVFARRDPTAELALAIGETRVAVAPVAAAPALLARAAAAAELGELDGELARATPERADALRTRLVRRALADRIVTSQTSLLVLETDADYRRYGIDRRALADVLAITPAGLELGHRVPPASTAVVKMEPADPPPPPEEMIEAAHRAGFLGPDSVVSGLAALTADTDFSVGFDDSTIYGPIGEGPAMALDEGKMGNQEQRGVDLPLGGASGASTSSSPVSRGALTGKLAEVEAALATGDTSRALAIALAWRDDDPADLLALVGLGEAREAAGDRDAAARAYGSIIDLAPERAELRRFAGERLERLDARALVIDTYRRAVAQRPDHLTGHRLLAYALVRAGRHAEGFAAILAGLDREYPADRFAGGTRVLREDAAMIGAVYAAHDPAHRRDVLDALARHGLAVATEPSTRFVLYWETDANDVDLHVTDATGQEAYYGQPGLASGGELYADVTTGYGPECFAIPGTPHAAPYQFAIHYFSRGAMGYGMGLLQIQRFDGAKLTFDDRPFVVMADRATVNRGTYP